MVLPKIFFLYLDMDTDDARVCNEIFECVKNWIEVAENNDVFVTTGKESIAHIIFLDSDIGEDRSRKVNRLLKKFKGAIQLLTRNNIHKVKMRGHENNGTYQLAIKSQKNDSEASITFYLEKIEDK